MALIGDARLDSGDQLPTLSFETVAHGTVSVPDTFEGRWGVLIAYRAHW